MSGRYVALKLRCDGDEMADLRKKENAGKVLCFGVNSSWSSLFFFVW